MAVVEIWTYRAPEPIEDLDLTGFTVEATDGDVGKVTEASNELGASWLVVDTGPWILGKKVLLPAGVVSEIDADERKIYVDRPRDEIKAAPEHDPSGYRDQEYRLAIADHYAHAG
jgi:PRC-barrel domain protein